MASRRMEVVRIVRRGERIDNIINEVKGLTFSNDREYALVKLSNGDRAIVSGDRDGIEFTKDAVTRIFGHTHPYSRPATGFASTPDKEMLDAFDQRSSYILEHGVLFKYTVE